MKDLSKRQNDATTGCGMGQHLPRGVTHPGRRVIPFAGGKETMDDPLYSCTIQPSIFVPVDCEDVVLDGALYGLEEDADGCVTAVALDGSSVSLDDHIVGLL